MSPRFTHTHSLYKMQNCLAKAQYLTALAQILDTLLGQGGGVLFSEANPTLVSRLSVLIFKLGKPIGIFRV